RGWQVSTGGAGADGGLAEARRCRQMNPHVASLYPGHTLSLPGLTPQVGFTRLAALNNAQLGKPELRCNPSSSQKLLRRRWMRGYQRVYARLRRASARAWRARG